MIKRVEHVILISICCLGFFLSTVSIINGAEPIIGDIKLNPTNPAPQSVVTFSVDINGDSISSVRIIVFECNKEIGLCHAPPQNISMNKVDEDTYEAEIKLLHDDVTSTTYHVEIESDGKWIVDEEYTTTLSIPSGDSDSNGNNSNGSPGFETIFLLIAIISVGLFFKRFKSK
jgi:hypothetical protein